MASLVGARLGGGGGGKNFPEVPAGESTSKSHPGRPNDRVIDDTVLVCPLWTPLFAPTVKLGGRPATGSVNREVHPHSCVGEV